ncbi:MAG: hypothetical protein EOM14_06385 [Clostridia bacterium]|nr:hypothetical protein [Clostridia bacterium]
MAVVLCLSLIAGCGDKTEISGAASDSSAALVQTQTPEVSETIDFENYVGCWISVKAEDEELYRIDEFLPYHGTTDLSIDEIKDGHVKGSIFAASEAVNASDYHMTEVSFEGDITDGKLSASYEDDGWNTSGSIELTFGEDMIDATITRDEQDSAYLWGIPEGSFTFLRQINTEVVFLPYDEHVQLEELLSLVPDDITAPFTENELTDETIIKILVLNIGLGRIDLSEFGDTVQTGAEITMDESVMDELADKYFGTVIQTHQSIENAEYYNEVYTIQELGGVTEFPEIAVMMQDTDRENTYYALVDYVNDYGDNGYMYEYQYLIKLQKNSDEYTIKSIEEIDEQLYYGTIPSDADISQ